MPSSRSCVRLEKRAAMYEISHGLLLFLISVIGGILVKKRRIIV